MSYGKGGGQGVQPSTGNPLTDYMGTQPGGATSAQPSANLGSMLSPAGQPVSYGTNSTGGQASATLQNLLFGNNPQTASLTSPLQNMGVSAQDASSILSDVITGLPPGVSPTTPFSQYPQVNSQPAAAVRDPRYNGMPDDIYNAMIRHQQQQQALIQRNLDNGLTGFAAYAIPDTTDIKPWQQWMAENPNGIQPTGSIQVDNPVQPPMGMMGKGGGQPIAQPAPGQPGGPLLTGSLPPPDVIQLKPGEGMRNGPIVTNPAPVTQPKQNSLTQALARTRTAGQGYVRPQARQVARNTQPRLSTAPTRNRTK